MTDKEEIAIVLTVKASHIMQRKNIVAPAPNPRVTVAVALQAAAEPNMDVNKGEVSPSSDTNPTKQHWTLEITRAKPKTKGKDSKI
eukprot:510744-Ditylum_brightwellii.AAC.1